MSPSSHNPKLETINVVTSAKTVDPKNNKQSRNAYLAGTIDMLPLSIAIFPWGVLAGSMAIEAGFTSAESLGLSLFVFAGAAQLVAISMIKAGVGITAILISVFFLTMQHLLYGLTLRQAVKSLPAKKRLTIGFLLTDELFALASRRVNEPINFRYIFGAGFSFYLFWNLFTLIGIIVANTIEDLDRFHLDFSIIATFIAIIVPMVKNITTLMGVIISLVLSMIFAYLKIPGAIIIAGLIGMFSAAFIGRIRRED